MSLKQLLLSEPNLVDHIGYYHCEAQNQWGKAKSEVLYVSPEIPTNNGYLVPPKFKIEPETEYAVFGASVQLECKATDETSRQTKIQWTLNGNVLEEFNEKEILEIEVMNTSDIGSYACNISNDVGYDYKTVPVNIIHQKPRFDESPSSQKKSVGQGAIFRCRVKGYPEPTTTWYVNTFSREFSV